MLEGNSMMGNMAKGLVRKSTKVMKDMEPEEEQKTGGKTDIFAELRRLKKEKLEHEALEAAKPKFPEISFKFDAPSLNLTLMTDQTKTRNAKEGEDKWHLITEVSGFKINY